MSFGVPTNFFDPPEVFDASITPVPGSGSSPVQVIANSGFYTAIGLWYSDTTGDFIGVYVGPPGAEKLGCIIGGGVTAQVSLRVSPYSRISLRSMTPNPITNGQLSAVLVSACA